MGRRTLIIYFLKNREEENGEEDFNNIIFLEE